MWRRRQDAGDLVDRFHRDASHLTDTLQEAVQHCTLRVVRRFAGQGCRVALNAEGGGSREVAESSSQVGEIAAFVQSAMLPDESSLSFEAGSFVVGFIMTVDAIDDLRAFPNDLPYYVALERVGFANGMIASRLGFVFEHASVQAFADVEWAPVRTAQEVDVVSASD